MRAIARNSRRRRPSVSAILGAVALTAALSMHGVAAASAASAQTVPTVELLNTGARTCLAAIPATVYPYNVIEQGQCTGSDPAQRWQLNPVTTPGGQSAYQLQNADEGGDFCLWAAPWQAYDRGGVYLMPCNASDPYQLWNINLSAAATESNFIFANVGTTTTCLDADGTTGGGAGQPIFQGTCRTADSFEQWYTL